MSALPPKADMCGATTDVRFGPKADIPKTAIMVLKIEEGRPSRGLPYFFSRVRLRLLGGTLDRISAEGRILLTDLQRRLIVGAVVPRFQLIHAVPSLNGDTFWWCPINRSDRFCTHSSGSRDGNEFAACSLDDCLPFRCEFFSVSVGVCHIDFSHKIY